MEKAFSLLYGKKTNISIVLRNYYDLQHPNVLPYVFCKHFLNLVHRTI